MVRAELYLLCNAAMCACALPLGGRLAGLPAPGIRRLSASATLAGAMALLALLVAPYGLPALGALPLCVWLCFGRHGAQACVRCTLTTLCASLLLGGAATWLGELGAPIVGAAVVSVALCSALYLLARLLPTTMCEVRQVEIRHGDSAVILPAMLDSGNLLRDPLTGLHVLVAPERALKPLFPDADDLCAFGALMPGFRLLSVRTAAGGGLWPMFRPDGCTLYLNGKATKAELLVAVAGREYGGVQALVPMSALAQR